MPISKNAKPPNSLSAFDQPYQRLSLYDPKTNTFVPVKPNDTSLDGKNVTVLVHGFAPGYAAWVDAAKNWVNPVTHKRDGYVLTWWDTFLPERPASIPAAMPPQSAFLEDGHSHQDWPGPNVVESTAGLVWDLTHFGNPSRNAKVDPNAVVLAYTWLDDSATSNASTWYGAPTQGFKSEAKTTLNGQRLAVALEQVLGTDAQFHRVHNGQSQGKLQLIGHSHGSKVVTVATGALANAPAADRLTVNQLTILDSPETGQYYALDKINRIVDVGKRLAQFRDANDNWYFLQDLKISDTDASKTLVDNYWSALGEPYGVISIPNPKSPLNQVVDVQLYPNNYAERDAGRHTYAAYWYAGSSEAARTKSTVGAQWSRLLSSTLRQQPSANILYQNWTSYAGGYPYPSEQFNLVSYSSNGISPVISPVKLRAQTASTGESSLINSDQGASVTLKQHLSQKQSFTARFTTASTGSGIRGLLFNYQFTNFQQGDELTIYLDGKLAFMMDPFKIQPGAQPQTGGKQAYSQKGTISVGDSDPGQPHQIRFVLTSPNKNSDSSVTLSNLMQYNYSS